MYDDVTEQEWAEFGCPTPRTKYNDDEPED